VPSERICLGYDVIRRRCIKELRVVKDPDDQYVDIVVIRKRRGLGGVETKPIARLPRFTGRVYDPYASEWRYVAVLNGVVVASAPDFGSFIEQLRQLDCCRVLVGGKYLDVLRALLPEAEAVLTPGLTEGGFADPYGVLDLTDYGVASLKTVWKWVKETYSNRDASYAMFNVFVALAKLMTPLIRPISTFVDHVVYNVRKDGDMMYVLRELLGGEKAQRAYYIVVTGTTTENQLASLVASSRMPLVLDVPSRRVLIDIEHVLFATATARRHNFRGVILFTDVPFSVLLRRVAKWGSALAYARRFIEIRWDFERPGRTAFAEPPQVKPILGFAGRIWTKHRDELMKVRDLLELVEKLTDVLTSEHRNDIETVEMLTTVKQVVTELRERKEAELARL